MARIKLEIPKHIIYTCKIPVRVCDVNYGCHVGNDAFVNIIHEARAQWLNKYGYTELQIEGNGLVMSELVIEFKKESFYGDVVDITLYVGEIFRIGFELYYQLFTTRNKEPLLLTKAKTVMICYDYESKKTVSIPKNLNTILTA